MSLLILASSSKYRHQLLKNAGYEFEYDAPDIDETPLHNEQPQQLVVRLAKTKCARIAPKNTKNDFILALDQVLTYENLIFGKPKSQKEAIDTIMRLRNQKAELICALALSHNNDIQTEVSRVILEFGDYSEAEVVKYLELEQPYDCAAGLKTETRGALLLNKIYSEDPTSIIGMPILSINRMLRAAGFPNMPLNTSKQ